MADYREIEMPDGSIVEFPSEMSDADISKYIRNSFKFKGRATSNKQDLSNFQEHPFMSGIVGFNTAVERPVQGLMQLLMGNNSDALNNVARKREENYAKSKAINPGSTIAGDVVGNIGLGVATGAPFNALALKMAPMLKSSPYLANILSNTLAGGALGGAQYVEPGESRVSNMLEGAGIGGGISALLPGLGKAASMGWRGLKRTLGLEDQMMKDFLKNFTPEEMKLALENKNIAEKLGVQRTPAELSNNRIASAEESRLGVSHEGQRNLYEFNKLQKKLDEEAIKKLINDITPLEGNASEEGRNVARSIIEKREKALQEKARPFYEKAENIEISSNKLNELTKDGNINSALKDVLNDERFAAEIAGFSPNSIKVLDEVKKRLDGLIGAANASGDKNLARIIKKSKDKLVSALDDISPDYKKARGIYSEESPLVDLLRKRQIGKIANLNDDQLKQVSNIIFDAGDLDIKTIKRLASEFQKENPEVWNKIIRNHIEGKLDTSYVGRTGYHGTNFYNQFLAQDKHFDKLMAALSHNPKAQETLTQMRQIFKDILNQPTARGSAAQAKSHVDVSRNWLAEAKKFASQATGGHYDKAMIDIITSDKWQKAFEKALKETKSEHRVNKMKELFEEINSIAARTQAARETATRGPFLITSTGYEVHD